MPMTPGLALAVLCLGVEPAAPEAEQPVAVEQPAAEDAEAPDQVEPPADTGAVEPVAAPVPTVDPTALEDVNRRLDALERENAELREEVEFLREDQDYVEEKIEDILPITGRVGGYLDFGFFWVGGNGSGLKTDIGHKHFPEYGPPESCEPDDDSDECTDGIVPGQWVFMGDPLSTAINSRGDPAQTDPSLAVKFDPIHSNGKSSFIVNALNLKLFAGLGPNLTFDGLVDFVPRSRDVSDQDGLFLGDYLDVKLAYARYEIPVKSFDFSIYVGKFDPVVGYEYRIQEAPDRISVTPSLICRYLCGRPLGLKFRTKFLPRRSLILNLSVANGSNFQEGFGMFNETDTNHFKTVSGRLSYNLPILTKLEAGGSGAFGAQDFQPEDDVYQWQWGFDLHMEVAGLDLTGEFVKGKVAGQSDPAEVARCGIAQCLDFIGAYGLIGYRFLNWLTPYARVDWRDALHEAGAEFVYISELIRVTSGIRFDIGEHVIIKAEYTVNRELGNIPQFDNDIVTSSFVAHF